MHENVIYLPGIKLPKSIIAQPDIKMCVTDATMMVFVIPHNFLAPIVPQMEGAFAPGAVGISLIKGIEFKVDPNPDPNPTPNPNLSPNPSPSPSPNPMPKPKPKPNSIKDSKPILISDLLAVRARRCPTP